MTRFPKSYVSVGVACLALAALILVTPRAVHAVAAALVQVMNTTANPVIASNMDDPGRIPYQARGQSSCSGMGTCEFHFANVPANHRLVVQHIDVTGTISAQSDFVEVGLFGGPVIILQPPVLSLGEYWFGQDIPVLAFFDAGSTPGGRLQSFVTPTFNSASMVLSGYMLDCSAASCAPIVAQ